VTNNIPRRPNCQTKNNDLLDKYILSVELWGHDKKLCD
jgi:hypothetical protein